MSRILAGSVLLVACVLSLYGIRAAVPDEKPAQPTPAQVLQGKLAKAVSIPGFEASTPFKEALDFLAEKHSITILIDVQSFQTHWQIQEPENQPVKLPAMNDVPLREVLRLLCHQACGSFVQRGNILMIVAPQEEKNLALGQSVDVDCKERALDRVLAELSDKTGCNIALDARRAGEAAKQPITLRLAGVPLKTAVTLAADLAGLEVVPMDSTLYVTTKSNARRLARQHEELRMQEGIFNPNGPEPPPNDQ